MKINKYLETIQEARLPNIKNEKIRLIKDKEFDKIVRETYNKPFCFQQQCGENARERGIYKFEVPNKNGDEENNELPLELDENDDYPMGVRFETWIKTDRKKYDIEFWEQKFYPALSYLVNDLYKKGKIKKGKYAIEVNW